MKKIFFIGLTLSPLLFAAFFAGSVDVDRLIPAVLSIIIYLLFFIEFKAFSSGAGFWSILVIAISNTFLFFDFGELLLIFNTFALCIGTVLLLTHIIIESDEFNGTSRN